MDEEHESRASPSGLPPPAPDRSLGSPGSRPPPPTSLSKAGSIARKTRSMRINISSNSVQFDTSTILEDFLYLGAKGVTGDQEKLNGLRIGYIVNCTQDPPTEYPEIINYFHVDVGDTTNDDIARYFDAACEFIEEGRRSGKSVLVHCTMGMSRSCSIVLAYLVKHHGMSLAQAFMHVKERRPVTSPNPGFMAQLVQYEKKYRGKATIDPDKYALTRFGDARDFIIA